jgi:nucleotide-binding universal stress UspA family protein
MQHIHTILCPIDFSAATRRQTELAVDLCRVFGARLVLHHNISGLSAGMAVGWMYAADHPPASEADADRRMQEFMKSLPPDVSAIAHVTRGQLSQTVIGLAGAVGADLVVLSTHGEGQADPDADDQASLAEQVLDRAACAVIALHQPAGEPNIPRFTPTGPRQVLVVPTDFTAGSQAALDFACDLSRKIPFELHLVHFLPSRAGRDQARDLVQDAERRLNDMLPKDLAGSAKLHVDTGDAVRGIPDAARRLSAACIVMGEHTRRPIRRWLNRDTARAVLHEAPCPVWYVPGQRVA